MNALAIRIATAPASVRWRLGELLTRTLYPHAFGALGKGSVIVLPRKLRRPDRIFIGREVKIYEGSWLAVEDMEQGAIHIGDGTYFGHDVHLHAADPIFVGKDCWFADGVYVGAADHGRENRHEIPTTGPVRIGDNVFIGQRAIVLGGVTIGDGATIGAAAVVTRDVAPGAVVAGVPARELGRR